MTQQLGGTEMQLSHRGGARGTSGKVSYRSTRVIISDERGTRGRREHGGVAGIQRALGANKLNRVVQKNGYPVLFLG